VGFVGNLLLFVAVKEFWLVPQL